MSASGSMASAAASAAWRKVSASAAAPVRPPSAAASRTGRSVAALTATRASAIGLQFVRYHTAAPTVGQSSAESAVNFSYHVRDVRRLRGHLDFRNQLVGGNRGLVVADATDR